MGKASSSATIKERGNFNPAEVASRAAFFARLHRESSVEDWIKKIVAERVEIEAAAFAEAKRDLATQ